MDQENASPAVMYAMCCLQLSALYGIHSVVRALELQIERYKKSEGRAVDRTVLANACDAANVLIGSLR